VKHSAATLYQKEGTKKVLASLISILVGLLVGGIAVILVGCFNEKISLSGAWDGFRIIFAGIFSTGRNAAGELTWGFNAVNTGDMLFRATPLIMTGLSVAVAFKTGLFNIGAPGQYLISTMATLMIALSIPSSSVPTWIIWILAFLGGCLAGALWGALPGLAKACLNINEVLACIMTNWVAANLVTWMFDISNFKNTVENTKSGYIYKTSFNGVATPKLGLDKLFPGSQVNAGILVAILLAIAMYILMTKTTLGYELQACGANRHAARYAGIKDKRNIVLSMAIAGALAGAGAALYYLSGNTEFYWSTYQSLPAVGFNGIPVALLALNNRRHLRRHLHGHAEDRGPAADQPHRLQRVHHRRHHRRHRVSKRFLSGDPHDAQRPEEEKDRRGRHGSHPSGRRRGGSDLPAAGGGESTRRDRCHRQR